MKFLNLIFKIIILTLIISTLNFVKFDYKNFSNNSSFEQINTSNLSVTFSSPITKTQDWYGRVLKENVYLYLNPDTDNISNALFSIEPSYFVKLIESANDKYYKAQYLDIIGYIKKADVKVTSTTPTKPFLNNINFRIYSEISQTMRTVPSSSEGSISQVCYLPLFSKDALYYGKIEGESAISGRTNIWYFCRFYSDKAYYGYIYSDGCDQMTKFSENKEIVDYVDSPNFDTIQTTANLTVISSDDKNYVLIIALISIPVGIFLIMLIRSNIILKSKKKEKAKEIKLFFDS